MFQASLARSSIVEGLESAAEDGDEKQGAGWFGNLWKTKKENKSQKGSVAFRKLIMEESKPKKLPSRIKAISCDCGQPCQLVAVYENGESQGYDVWICASGGCMYCQVGSQEHQINC